MHSYLSFNPATAISTREASVAQEHQSPVTGHPGDEKTASSPPQGILGSRGSLPTVLPAVA